MPLIEREVMSFLDLASLFCLERILMKESEFQKKLIDKIKMMFPGCEVMKQDAQYHAGMPDLVIFYKNHYAMLEVKKSEKASHRPNQDFYVKKFRDWSYASFVFPENLEKVLSELQEVFSK